MMSQFTDGKAVLEHLKKPYQEGTFEQIKQYYSAKKYIFETNDVNLDAKRIITGADLKTSFRRPINPKYTNVGMIKEINRFCDSVVLPSTFEEYTVNIAKALLKYPNISYHYKFITEQCLLKYPLRYLKIMLSDSGELAKVPAANKANVKTGQENILFSLRNKGSVLGPIIKLYKSYSAWLYALKKHPLVNIYKYAFMIIFNIYLNECTVFDRSKLSSLISDLNIKEDDINKEFMHNISQIPISSPDIINTIDYIKGKLGLIKIWFHDNIQLEQIFTFITSKYTSDSNDINSVLGSNFLDTYLTIDLEVNTNKSIRRTPGNKKMTLLHDTDGAKYNNELLLPDLDNMSEVNSDKYICKLILSVILQFIYSCKTSHISFNTKGATKYLYTLPYKIFSFEYKQQTGDGDSKYDSYVFSYEYLDDIFEDKSYNVEISKNKINSMPLSSTGNITGDTVTSVLKYIENNNVEFLEKTRFHNYFNYGMAYGSDVNPINYFESREDANIYILTNLETTKKYLDIVIDPAKIQKILQLISNITSNTITLNKLALNKLLYLLIYFYYANNETEIKTELDTLIKKIDIKKIYTLDEIERIKSREDPMDSEESILNKEIKNYDALILSYVAIFVLSKKIIHYLSDKSYSSIHADDMFSELYNSYVKISDFINMMH